MNNLTTKQLKQLNKKEERIIAHSIKANEKTSITLNEKIEQKIPEKLKQVLDNAFYQGFCFIFSKGVPVIERTYDKEKLSIDFDVNNYAIDKKLSKKSIKNLDQQAKKNQIINSCITALEGSGLGLLGIGLPDIQVFIAALLKGIFETALSYGFSYDSLDERYYILLLIRTALTTGKTKSELNRRLNETVSLLARGKQPVYLFDDELRLTSDALAQEMLAAKFIQGLPVIGVVGGFCNLSTSQKIFKFAGLKYKKRYLIGKELS